MGVYIRQDEGRQPGANTVAYYPFSEDILDHSGNSYTISSSSNSQQSVGYDFTGYCRANVGSTTIKTISAWIKIKNYDGPYTEALRYNKGYFQYYKYHYSNASLSNTITVFTSSSYAADSESYTMNLNEWYHVVFVNDTDNSKTYGYINGVKEFEGASPYNFNLSDVYLWADRDGSYSHFYTGTATLSECIMENVTWSAADVQSYYNRTKSDYIWTPNANTIAYYPLTTDWSDHSGNGYDLTNNGGTIATQGGVSCAYFSGSSSVYSVNTTAPVGATRTIACWMYLQSPTSGSAVGVWTGTYNASTGQHNAEVLGAYNSNTSLSDYHAYGVTGSTSITNQRVFLVGVVSGNDVTCYLNGAVDASGTRGYESTDSVGIKLSGRLGGSGSEYMKGYLSDVIVESTAWTATDVLNYYNQTKSKYGL